ncbi:hypothetical protein GCM10023259_032940 [Thermocatellispora tengchongensis]
MATRRKKATTTADATPVRSRRKRSHISRPGERPVVTGTLAFGSATGSAAVPGAAGTGVVIVLRAPKESAGRAARPAFRNHCKKR